MSPPCRHASVTQPCFLDDPFTWIAGAAPIDHNAGIMDELLLDYLPREKIIAAFRRSPGNEIESGKFASPESSAALAANTFGLFLDSPEDLPPIPNTCDLGWPALHVSIERCVRFPWSGGRHPWLDAFIETPTHIIGIESKRYEPFRKRKNGHFSDAYWRPVWGTGMAQFERMRDQLADGTTKFERLDGYQLVKHALGLVSEARRCGKAAALVYLYAEPSEWPDGTLISAETTSQHNFEATKFAEKVAGADVVFRICRYSELLTALQESRDQRLVQHAAMISKRFNP